MTTMLFERVGDVLVLVHGVDDPTDAEWNPVRELRRGASAQHDTLDRPARDDPGRLAECWPAQSHRGSLDHSAHTDLCVHKFCDRTRGRDSDPLAHRWPMYGLRLDQIEQVLELMKVPADQHKVIRARLQRQLSASPTA